MRLEPSPGSHPGRWLEGRLSGNGQSTALKGDPVLVGEYAVWLRQWQPDAPLAVLSDSDGALMALTAVTTAEAVEAHLAV